MLTLAMLTVLVVFVLVPVVTLNLLVFLG